MVVYSLSSLKVFFERLGDGQWALSAVEALVEVVFELVAVPDELLLLGFAAIDLLLFVDELLVIDHLDQCFLALLPAFVNCLQLFIKLLNTLANVRLVTLQVVGLLIRLNLVHARHVNRFSVRLFARQVSPIVPLVVNFRFLLLIANRVLVFLYDEPCSPLRTLSNQILLSPGEELANIQEILLLDAHEMDDLVIGNRLDTQLVLAAVVDHCFHRFEDQVAL